MLVENKPGVLTRVTSLFARRGFNIDSLAVGPTEDETLSRITLVVSAAVTAGEGRTIDAGERSKGGGATAASRSASRDMVASPDWLPARCCAVARILLTALLR